MDPTLKAYLDKMLENLTKANEDTRADIKQLAGRIDNQSAQVDALTAWKPDLEARLSKLQETVGALQGARTPAATAPASGSRVMDLPDLLLDGGIHGPDGHGESHQQLGGLPSGGVPSATSPANEFVEDPRTDIRAVVMVQRPKDLDTACALAILQEEVTEGHRGHWYNQSESTMSPGRTRHPAPMPLPPPPPRAPNISPVTEDRRGTDAAHASNDASKLTALRNFRRTKGLCFKCGER